MSSRVVAQEFLDDNHKLHRDNGPALIWNDGSVEWWQHGRRHRVGAPALIYTNGAEEWWINGKRHRIDGPAYIGNMGIRFWCLNGNIVDNRDTFQQLAGLTDEDMTVLMLRFGGY